MDGTSGDGAASSPFPLQECEKLLDGFRGVKRQRQKCFHEIYGRVGAALQGSSDAGDPDLPLYLRHRILLLARPDRFRMKYLRAQEKKKGTWLHAAIHAMPAAEDYFGFGPPWNDAQQLHVDCFNLALVTPDMGPEGAIGSLGDWKTRKESFFAAGDGLPKDGAGNGPPAVARHAERLREALAGFPDCLAAVEHEYLGLMGGRISALEFLEANEAPGMLEEARRQAGDRILAGVWISETEVFHFQSGTYFSDQTGMHFRGIDCLHKTRQFHFLCYERLFKEFFPFKPDSRGKFRSPRERKRWHEYFLRAEERLPIHKYPGSLEEFIGALRRDLADLPAVLAVVEECHETALAMYGGWDTPFEEWKEKARTEHPDAPRANAAFRRLVRGCEQLFDEYRKDKSKSANLRSLFDEMAGLFAGAAVNGGPDLPLYARYRFLHHALPYAGRGSAREFVGKQSRNRNSWLGRGEWESAKRLGKIGRWPGSDALKLFCGECCRALFYGPVFGPGADGRLVFKDFGEWETWHGHFWRLLKEARGRGDLADPDGWVRALREAGDVPPGMLEVVEACRARAVVPG